MSLLEVGYGKDRPRLQVMFPAQEALGKQQFAIDTDNAQQLLAAGANVARDRL